ncbi:hypothetical protein QTP88_000007 [Uroleucon formosanum]
MLFSAIRAKGGFNNNPTVSQFEAAYKSIIVHSEIKSSSSANCMALDDTTILTVSSSNIKVKDTQSELLDLLCVAGTDDLENDNLVSVYQHSNFINDVVACIAGFVVRKIKKKTILCDTCAVEIEVGSSESKLLDRKNRGGLIKPSHDVVQIFQTSNPEAYRTLVHYLRNEKAEFHTFQLKEDKPMRIVIRNLHPSTSTEMIKNELEHRLYEVRQVTQVISKIPLPLFFVDLEPTDHSKEIFKLESILHTKIKIEEPHKPKIISQCQNCQAYGHTKAYCGYSPRCVRCGDDHSSSACPNSRQDPMRCAFCTGNHPANYRGCTVYKNLQQRKKTNLNNHKLHVNTSYKSNNVQDSHPRNTTSCNPPSGHSQTYAQATQGQHLQSDIPPPTPDINSLMSSFVSKLKTLINPLITLLTQVISSLLARKNE